MEFYPTVILPPTFSSNSTTFPSLMLPPSYSRDYYKGYFPLKRICTTLYPTGLMTTIKRINSSHYYSTIPTLYLLTLPKSFTPKFKSTMTHVLHSPPSPLKNGYETTFASIVMIATDSPTRWLIHTYIIQRTTKNSESTKIRANASNSNCISKIIIMEPPTRPLPLLTTAHSSGLIMTSHLQ